MTLPKCNNLMKGNIMSNYDIEQTCQKIEKDFYNSKPFKKRAFLSAIKSVSLFLKLYEHNTPNAETRAKILRLCYMYFREIDDLIDGDKALPNSSNNYNENKKIITEYMQVRRNYLANGCTSSNPNELDEIIKVIMDLSASLGLDLKDDSIKLLDCMLFDLNRKSDLQNGQIVLSTNAEIDKYFFRYYYDSCIKIAVLLTTSNPKDISNKNISDLGYAQRTYFDLEDFLEDLSFGIINIPSEDVCKLKINENSLIKLARLPKNMINLCKHNGFNHPSVSKVIDDPIMIWLNQQLDFGSQHLDSYQKNAPLRTPFSVAKELLFQRKDFSDIVLKLGIERGTNNYLDKLNKQREKNVSL